MAIDRSIPARQRLLTAFIVSDLQEGLAENMITMNPPEITTLNDRNTRVVFQVYEDDKLYNTVVVYYNREDLTAVIGTGQPTIPAEGLATTHDLLPNILATLGIAFDPEDIVNEPLTSPIHVLKATADSFGYTGTVELMIADNGDLGFNLHRTNDEKLIMLNGKYWRVA